MRNIVAGDTTVTNRRAYFTIFLLDGVSPALGEAGNQPLVILNGASPQGPGYIGTLQSSGFGKYYADIDPSKINVVGDVLQTFYQRTGITLLSEGDTFLIVSSTGSGLTPINASTLLSYGTPGEGDGYFANRLNTSAWDNATNEDKLKALSQSTAIIDNLNIAGDKADPNQPLQFPRASTQFIPNTTTGDALASISGFIPVKTTDTLIPDAIKVACYEIAIKLLDGVDPEEEINAVMADSHGYANVKTSYNRRFIPDHILAGVPSSTAWNYLKPFLRDPTVIKISRVS